MKGAWWLTLLGTSVAVALYLEWHTDEVTVVLAMLSLSAVALGAFKPERALISGAVLGYSVLAAHGVTEAAGALRPRYLHSAVSTGDWIAMAVLGLWIIALAWFGGFVRTKLGHTLESSRTA